MFGRNFRNLRKAVLAIFSLVALASPSLAADKSFSKLPGRWVGNGWIQMTSGDRETIRCTATYFLKKNGNSLNQNLRCASASYTVVGKGLLDSKGGKISGSWNEQNFDLSGQVSGVASGNTIKLNVNGPNFKAKFSVKTTGTKQSVVISSQGNNIAKLVINLRKG